MHGIQDRKAVLVRDVIGQFQLMEGDHFLHPLFPRAWGVGVDIHSFGHFWVGFSCHHPAAVVKFVSTVINGDDVHQQNIFCSFVQSGNSDFEWGKHASSRFGDDHFGADFVELVPQVFAF